MAGSLNLDEYTESTFGFISFNMTSQSYFKSSVKYFSLDLISTVQHKPLITETYAKQDRGSEYLRDK